MCCRKLCCSLDSAAGAQASKLPAAGKAKCKAALQKELGFDQDPSKPLVGWIGRLDFQKGPDVVLQAVPEMAHQGCQVGKCPCAPGGDPVTGSPPQEHLGEHHRC